jgi:CRP-like cAMP-binding protein
VVCHHFHVTLQRLCRWLLAASDRLHTDRLDLTQEMLGSALGIPRTGVTTAALELQEAEAIHYRRGRIAIVNTHARGRRPVVCQRPPTRARPE